MTFVHTLIGHGHWVRDVIFSSQGNQLASASDDGTVVLWMVGTSDCNLTLTGHNAGVMCVAFSPKGDLLASGSLDKTVRLWDVASGQCRAVIQNLQGPVFGVAWTPSPDANFLISGCEDGSVLKWEVLEEEEQCHVNLCWGAIKGSLSVSGASIQDVRGLNALNKQLLMQRGAEGEPVNPFREASKKLVTMASVVSQMRQPPGDGMIPDSLSMANVSDEQSQQQVDQQDEWQDEQQMNSKPHRRRYRRIVRKVRR
jgi:hypothetical protein